jgi:hypothetical protein
VSSRGFIELYPWIQDQLSVEKNVISICYLGSVLSLDGSVEVLG